MLKKTIFGLTEADETKSSKILDLAQKEVTFFQRIYLGQTNF